MPTNTKIKEDERELTQKSLKVTLSEASWSEPDDEEFDSDSDGFISDDEHEIDKHTQVTV